jgi:hypothetical protein
VIHSISTPKVFRSAFQGAINGLLEIRFGKTNAQVSDPFIGHDVRTFGGKRHAAHKSQKQNGEGAFAEHAINLARFCCSAKKRSHDAAKSEQGEEDEGDKREDHGGCALPVL